MQKNLSNEWTVEADLSLKETSSYLSSTFGETVVIKFLKKLNTFTKYLLDFPEIGMIYDKHHNIRSFVLVKIVILFYRIIDERIVILKLFNVSQKPRKSKIRIG